MPWPRAARRRRASPSGGCASPAGPDLAGLPAGTTISSRAGLASALSADPLSLDTQQALLALAIAAVLLAVVGMLVSVATASDRTSDLALLDALGMPPGQIARLARPSSRR